MGKTRKETHFLFCGEDKPLKMVQGTTETFTDSKGKEIHVFYDKRGKYWFATVLETGLLLPTVRHDTKSGLRSEILKRVDEFCAKLITYKDGFTRIEKIVGDKIVEGDFIPYNESEV